MEKNFYDILMIRHDATKKEINEAYLNVSKLYVGNNRIYRTEKISELNTAFRVLRNDYLREKYDEYLNKNNKNEIDELNHMYDNVFIGDIYKVKQTLSSIFSSSLEYDYKEVLVMKDAILLRIGVGRFINISTLKYSDLVKLKKYLQGDNSSNIDRITVYASCFKPYIGDLIVKNEKPYYDLIGNKKTIKRLKKIYTKYDI